MATGYKVGWKEITGADNVNPRCRVQKKAVEWMPQNLYAAAAPISKRRW